MSLSRYLISVIFFFCLFHNVWPGCVFQDGKYDLSALDLPGGWMVAGPNINGTSSHYKISVCHPLNYPTNSSEGGCTNSSVCFFSSDQTTSFGDALDDSKNYAIAAFNRNGFTMFVHTKIKCGSKTIQRATIKFACGPNLGVPELVLISECQVNFHWKTSAACRVKPKTRQVPCYALDGEGEKRDLSHLIKPTGGYFVNTPNPAVEFVINVCSDILPDNDTLGCPANSSACRIIGSEKLSFGSPQNGLQYTPEGLILTYKAHGFPAGCNLEPKTTVLFKCPDRGHSQPPKVISDFNCQYEVEWETEYACPESSLKGDIRTCQFTAETHGVEIDLSPLRQQTAYIVKSNSSNTTEFALSVCGGLGNYSCGDQTRWKSMSVCMIDSLNNTAHIVGTMVGTKLMYADDEVILSYPKGSFCESSIEHSTVINFICDPDAVNNGTGVPQHVSSDHCVHHFEWSTKHACLKHLLDTPCSVTYENKKISLQKLLLIDGEPWEAIDRRDYHNRNDADYYINVCGQISNLGNLSCGEGSSACVMFSNGTYLNLGNFTSPPVFDVTSNSVRLEYTGGSQCKAGKNWNSVIDFICRPGHINSEPILTRVDETECRYEFEWQTAEACPEGMIEGTGCKVYDDSLGINYDLNPLKSETYEVDTGLYKFYLGVCEPAKDTPCSKNQNSSANVGVCQVDQSSQLSWKTGESNSNISYMDGVVNLTYLSGDPYNDANKTARMTIIIFICDFKAGKGNPHFVEEVNFAYVFHWYTDLVCQPPAFFTECLVHDPASHLIYDLSGLSSSKENWVTHVSDEDGEKQIYLNICRPLSRPSVCDSKAAACVTETTDSGEKVAISNIGRALGPPVLESPGHLSLTYTQGNPCVAFGQNITYTTVIHFLCGEQFSKMGPMFLNKLGACEFTFLWTTSAACPTGSLQAKSSCELTDPDSGFTFDLMPLQMEKQPYSVETSSGIFQFNICGKIMEGCTTSDGKYPSQNTSVCQVDKDGNKISEIATANNYSLSYSQGQDLTLTYKPLSSSPKGSEEEVIIKFPCYNGTVDPKPKFIRHEDGRYIFEMPTRLTCIPGPVDCTAVDSKGNEYDLSPLAKFSDGNWDVADFRPENMRVIYHINFCRPLNKVKSYKCPGGASSACQTNTLQKDAIGLDLGSQMSPPTVSDTGTVVIRFTNGSFCPNGQFRRSTTINQFCNMYEGELTFIGETPECEYVFSLDTPVACAIQNQNGNDCKVREPQFGYTFDLNPLKSKNNNYNITVKDYKYYFNVCDKLNSFNNECMNSSVCQTKPSDEKFFKSLGLPNDKLMYRKGVITLEYNSGSGDCHGKYNRSTYITFTCDHESKDRDGPEFIAESEDCTYSFEWPTIHACPPFDVVECSVIDNDGRTYDFSQLSLVKSNYLIKNPFSNNKTFVLNLCRSVVHTPDSLCPYTAASCLVDNSGASESISLGRVNQGPYFDGNKIKIKYTSGDQCNEEKTSTSRFWETVIEFNCSPHVTESEPQFVGKDGCTYYFDWDVAFACSEIEPVRNMEDCTVEDPITGFVYNLTALSNHGVFKTETAKHQYYLNICKSNGTTPCGTGVGVCQEEIVGQKRSWKAGQPNSKLQYIRDVLVLNYTNGDLCHNGLFQRNSIIEFHCGSGIGEPRFLFESTGCTYYFSWKTELACQNSMHMHCAITNGSQYYDLSSLAETYHVASSSIANDDAEYYVSVCKPLPLMVHNNHCPPGAGICRVTQHGSSAKFGESLGKPEIPPFVDFMDKGTIIYTNGSSCKSRPEESLRSRIIFLCSSEAGMGEPVLTLADGNECIYIFEWRTSLVCPSKPDVQEDLSCNYTDRSRGIHFDLSPLKSSLHRVDDDKSSGHFLLQVCSSLHSSNISNCDDSGVCLVGPQLSHNYGVASTQKFEFDGHRLRLTLKNGDDCPSGIGGKYTSEIFFVCDPLGGYGEPVLHKKYTCLVVFMWKTALVCQNMQRQCSFDVNGSHYNFNLLSSLSHNWDTYDEHNNTYWINLCRGIQPSASTLGCLPSAAVCMKGHDNHYFTLGTIQTMQVKSINSTDLLLTFESGDTKACSDDQTRLPKIVTTRLFMKCGSTLGHPKKFSGPDSECYYDFLWESSLACAERNEIVIMEKDGIIKDERFGFTINISSILNSTFNATGSTGKDDYIYQINLSGLPGLPTRNPCAMAAVCQTKSTGHFYRDIGSFDTRTLVVRGTELHLTFTSRTKPCGKNPSKNVTTVINMQCVSAAGIGSPQFTYESGECDYVFEWETIAVCPDFHRITPEPTDDSDNMNPLPNPYKEEILSSHSNAAVIVGVIAAAIVITAIGFIVSKPERRALVAHRFRSIFGRVHLPHVRYGRSSGERLVLVDATEPHPYDDDRDVEMLT
ncbi:cation-independent mannose-6-phosphate receptor-like isoform X1 [Argiope bruennichi]|uniref:cation-independent mannose-6-phosphate receptor-like isoform X1 n=1 Tax=Argiope bruennichi TaxID=94029 RepID=UPI002493F754|nr:cation-independent mannose-6-phosphate receptor-like isoform X1 [Argiope bruennichi]